MDKKERNDLYLDALVSYGFANQRMMLVEEVGELLNAIAKHHRGRITDKFEVITELADVSIMVEQMAEHFGFADFEAEKERKLERLRERLKNKEG